MYHLNFNQKLQRVLREIRDLSSHNIKMELPQKTLQKIDNIDIMRLQAISTHLVAATSQFNIMEKSLLDIERDLISHNIQKAQKVLPSLIYALNINPDNLFLL